MRLRNPLRSAALLILSAGSVSLAAGLNLLRFPTELPSAFLSRLWLANVFTPISRFLALGVGRATGAGADPVGTSWIPLGLGIALLLPIVGLLCVRDRPRRLLGSLTSLLVSLLGLATIDLYTAAGRWNSQGALTFGLAIALGLGLGLSLVGLGLSIEQGGAVRLTRVLARWIRRLMIVAGVGIGSFVLAPLGSLSLTFALLAIAVAYARSALLLMSPDRSRSSTERLSGDRRTS